MKRIRHILAILLVVATAFAYMPLLGGAETAYAGSGYEERDCQWITSSVWGLPDGYAIAGSTIYIDSNNLCYMKDEGGSNVNSPLMEYYGYFEYVEISVDYFYGNGDVRERLGYGTMAQDEVAIDIPTDIANDDYILVIAKAPNGDYFYSTEIPVMPAKVSSAFMKNLGEITIELPETGLEKAITSARADALRNTFLIAENNGKVSITAKGDKFIDVDFTEDGIPDVTVSKEGTKGYILNLVDRYNTGGKSSKIIAAASGAAFDPQTLFEDHYLQSKIPYYSKVIFKIPPRYIDDGKATLKTTSYTYNGEARKPAVSSVLVNHVKLVKGTDYTVSYKNNKNVGKATVTIKGINRYGGTITKTFKINPKGTSLKAASDFTKGKTYVTVKWNKQAAKMSVSRITGYQVQIATNSSFTTGKKTYKVAGYSNLSKKFTGLKSGKKYYVRIRTYKTINKESFYSPWSAVKTVTTKK